MPRPAPTQVGIKLTYQVFRHTGLVPVSNVYHFNGPDWGSQAEFEAVADALSDAFKATQVSGAHITEAIGYSPGSFVPVYTKTYSKAGTYVPGSNEFAAPSDCALVLRFDTTQRTSKNHPIYLFKYIKTVYFNPGANQEIPTSAWKTAVSTFGQSLVDGYNDGTRTRKYCGPFGAVAQSKLAETYISHRDFPK